MRFLKITPVLLLMAMVLGSCNSVRVATDYDREVNFNQYQTYAFFKPGIDQAEISDLDKKRILRAIEAEMQAKGFTKSDDPDLLVSIFTKTRENINIYNNNMAFGYGWGWNPWFWGPNYQSINREKEGTLYIDLIDAEEKELVWQGMGTGALARKVDRKQERINKIVSEILEKYPPATSRR